MPPQVLLIRILREAAGAEGSKNRGYGADAYALAGACRALGLDVSPQLAGNVMFRMGIRDPVVEYEVMASAMMQKALVRALSSQELTVGPLKYDTPDLNLNGPIKVRSEGGQVGVGDGTYHGSEGRALMTEGRHALNLNGHTHRGKHAADAA